MPRFLVIHTDPDAHPLGVAEQKSLENVGARVESFTIGPEAFVEAARDADAILNADFRLTAPLIATLRRCRIISRFGTGVDNIDVEAATARGILVANVPEFCTEEVANRTLTLLLACACQLPRLDRRVREGKWRSPEISDTVQIEGQTLGLVGFGKIARAVARRARTLGLKLLAYDPYLSPSAFVAEGATPLGLEALLTNSDFISLHAPLTCETHHLINATTLLLVKPTAILINCARGALIDEQAMVTALGEHKLAGVGLDVLEEEPPAPDNPLLKMEQVILTPHSAALTNLALQRVRRAAVDAVVRVLSGEPPLHVVNPSVLRK